MKRFYRICIFQLVTVTFLFAQFPLLPSGRQVATNVATPPTQRMPLHSSPGVPPSPRSRNDSWTGKHETHTSAEIRDRLSSQSPGLPAPLFLTTPPTYAAGSDPFDMALGDFNSDGKQDVIVAANPPVLLLGNGDGTFQTAVPIGTISSAPTGVAVGDFNHDGKLDVVFAISGGAVVYFGNGNGTFGAGITVSSGGTNQNIFARVLVADVNGDGIEDLILNNDLNVSVLLGNSSGTFQAPINSPAVVQAMSAADFNKDGKLDLAITNGYNSVGILLGNGNGTFVTANSYSATFTVNLNSIAVADYNQDGFQDVALPNGKIFLGNGDGSLRPATTFQTGPGASAVSSVDINADGVMDLVTIGSNFFCDNFGTTGVSLGNGDGTFQPIIGYDTGGCIYPSFMAVGDLNSDGAPDLIVLTGLNSVDGSTSYLSVLMNKGNGTFPGAAAEYFSGGLGNIVVDDFNNDGNADVLLADGSIYLGNGDGTLRFLSNISLDAAKLATGDFNHDGNQDFVALGSGDGQVVVAFGNGDGSFQPPIALPPDGFPADSLVVADFNNDGNLDIALLNGCADSNCQGGSVSMYLGMGGTFSLSNTISLTPAPAGTDPFGPINVVAGDFNNDGFADLAVVGGHGCGVGWVNILLGNGDGSFQPPTLIYGDGEGIAAAVAGDFNHDGILDLVLAEGDSCQDGDASAQIMYGNGDGTFTAGVDIGGGEYPVGVVAADFFGTGNLIPVFADGCGSNPGYCLGGSVIVDGTNILANMMLLFPAVGDFNNDGKPDLVGSLQDQEEAEHGVSVLMNVGATLAATTTTISPLARQVISAFQPITFTARIQHTGPETLTGQVEFLDSGVSIGSAPVASNGLASFTTSSLAIGSHFVMAYYQGDSNFAQSSSLGVHTVVNKATTALALNSSANPSATGQPVTLTAKIVPQFGGQASGTVTFKDAAKTLGSVAVNGDVASLTSSSLVTGTHSITATYSGDSNFIASTSNTLSQVVTQSTTTTALVSSVNPSAEGKPVAFTAVVSSTGGTPTGKVEFLDGTTVLATMRLASGTAKYTTSKLPPGAQSITATYEGDIDNSGSTSPPVAQFVLAVTTTTLTSSPNPSAFGQTVVFSAVVASNSGVPSNGETVTFKQGTTVLGTGTLSGGKATLSTSVLAIGTKSVLAVYGGDSTFSGSTSKATSQVVQKATTTTTLVSSQNPSKVGQAVTFTSTVLPQFTGVPTGTMTFKDGTKTLGSVTLSAGTAKFTTSTLAAGTQNITATYKSSTDFSGSSGSLTQTVH